MKNEFKLLMISMIISYTAFIANIFGMAISVISNLDIAFFVFNMVFCLINGYFTLASWAEISEALPKENQ